jgi:hypothetical protein
MAGPERSHKARGVGLGLVLRNCGRPIQSFTENLLSEVELRDDSRVTAFVLLLEVLQKTPSLTNEIQQASAAVVVFRVNFEVLCEVINSVCQQSHLNLWRTRVGSRTSMFSDCGLF